MWYRTTLRLATFAALLVCASLAALTVTGRLGGRGSRAAHAQAPSSFTLATFAGNYGYSITGTVYLGDAARPHPMAVRISISSNWAPGFGTGKAV